jgi:hypothetical protein
LAISHNNTQGFIQKTGLHYPINALDAGSNKNIKDIEILLKRNWNFPKHIFNKNIERNI